MSDVNGAGTNGAAAANGAAKPKKEPAIVTKVKMTDGREVNFVGKRRLNKDYGFNEGEEGFWVRFDFVNGETRKVDVPAGDPLFAQLAAHGMIQKVGDETAGEQNVEDMVMGVDDILGRLAKGDWGAERAAGDGFSGASTVVRAIMEASGKDLTFVKAFLEKKLEAGKAAGLTRQKLYNSYRSPGSKTAVIIERIEREKLAKNAAISSDEINSDLDEMSAAGVVA